MEQLYQQKTLPYWLPTTSASAYLDEPLQHYERMPVFDFYNYLLSAEQCNQRFQQQSMGSMMRTDQIYAQVPLPYCYDANAWLADCLQSQTLSSPMLSNTNAVDSTTQEKPASRKKSKSSEPSKRLRTTYTSGQINYLEEFYFSKRKFISNFERAELAKRLGVTENQIRTWFQNRRARERCRVARQPALSTKKRSGTTDEPINTSFIDDSSHNLQETMSSESGTGVSSQANNVALPNLLLKPHPSYNHHSLQLMLNNESHSSQMPNNLLFYPGLFYPQNQSLYQTPT